MAPDTLPEPDRSWFRCHFCSGHVNLNGEPMPHDAWIKGVVSPEYRYVCPTCRTNVIAPRPNPEWFKCLGCRFNRSVPEPERRERQYDPQARIRLFTNAAKEETVEYVGHCAKCLSEQAVALAARSRLRLAAASKARLVEFQMIHIHELAVSYRSEKTSEGELRYTAEQAIERAVWLEMLIADWAKSPDFMYWLRERRPDLEEEAA